MVPPPLHRMELGVMEGMVVLEGMALQTVGMVVMELLPLQILETEAVEVAAEAVVLVTHLHAQAQVEQAEQVAVESSF